MNNKQATLTINAHGRKYLNLFCNKWLFFLLFSFSLITNNIKTRENQTNKNRGGGGEGGERMRDRQTDRQSERQKETETDRMREREKESSYAINCLVGFVLFSMLIGSACL